MSLEKYMHSTWVHSQGAEYRSAAMQDQEPGWPLTISRLSFVCPWGAVFPPLVTPLPPCVGQHSLALSPLPCQLPPGCSGPQSPLLQHALPLLNVPFLQRKVHMLVLHTSVALFCLMKPRTALIFQAEKPTLFPLVFKSMTKSTRQVNVQLRWWNI